MKLYKDRKEGEIILYGLSRTKSYYSVWWDFTIPIFIWYRFLFYHGYHECWYNGIFCYVIRLSLNIKTISKEDMHPDDRIYFRKWRLRFASYWQLLYPILCLTKEEYEDSV